MTKPYTAEIARVEALIDSGQPVSDEDAQVYIEAISAAHLDNSDMQEFIDSRLREWGVMHKSKTTPGWLWPLLIGGAGICFALGHVA